MIDLHTHTLFSDGELLPSELLRRAETAGYRAIAFTDHVDASNYDFTAPRIARACDELAGGPVTALPGVEITHVPPDRIGDLVKSCREAGARIIVVHGESIVEPVAPGTNRAAIEAGVDILAHPGLITGEDAALAAEMGVLLEISGRGGHSFTNGHVAATARKAGAGLVFNTDAHRIGDLMDAEMAFKVALGAGMSEGEVERMFEAAMELVRKAGRG
ncbi:MAG: histidinol phosphate phosphatase domain-containing protein [Candidatus Nitrospinota bacterium M3_3B_026]